jgi:signal transduction histidine kinase
MDFYNARMNSQPIPSDSACRTFTPALIDPPELTRAARYGLDWFSFAAIATWIACGLWPISSIASGQFTAWPAAAFVAAFAAYGAALIAILVLPRRAVLPLVVPYSLASVETVTGVFIIFDTHRYLNGTGMGLGLLVIVAAQLPYFTRGVRLWGWMIAQTVAMMVALMPTLPEATLEVMTFTLASLGFQAFAAASSILAISEGRARTNLARTNAELTATRELLAESSRTSERLRISRDLHDTLGHHLTALSLQLDVASRLSDGKLSEHIHQAHAITRLLLSDVREVVSSLRESSRVNLAEAIRALAVQQVSAQVHLDVPATLHVDDPDRAEAILRAVQEILTNTSRHARAANLWIQLESSDAGITLHARDDGRGVQTVVWGNGLRGMRERYEQHGGRVDVMPSAESGFEVHAFMPTPRST